MKMHVTIANQTMEVEIGDLNSRPITARIGEDTFEVWPEEKTAAAKLPPADGSAARPEKWAAAPVTAPASPAPAVAPAGGTTKSAKAETAPLPGIITGITVKPGSTVKPGQALLDIEAMKMKNTIRASREGEVAEILVAVGDSVRHGQILLKYA